MKKEQHHLITHVAYRAIIPTSGKRMARAAQEEAEHVLSCGYPGGFIADLEMEIISAQFAQYSVTLVSVLSGSAARSLVHLLFLLTGGFERAARAREPGTRVHLGPGNPVSAREEDHSTRGDEGSISRWDTSKRANRPHRYSHRAISPRE